MSSAKTVTALFIPTGSYEIAFQAANNSLNTYLSTDPKPTKGPGMQGGTRPSIGGLWGGLSSRQGRRLRVPHQPGRGRDKDQQGHRARHESEHRCLAQRRVRDCLSGRPTHKLNGVLVKESPTHPNTGYLMDPGSSPSIAALSVGGYEIAFQDGSNNHLLNVYSTVNRLARKTTVGMQKGTSPRHRGLVGDVLAHWRLGGRRPDQQGQQEPPPHLPTAPRPQLSLGMEPGTSPSIAVLSNGSYVVAFEDTQVPVGGSGRDLHIYPWPGGKPLSLGMYQGTSPSIAPLANSYVIAFEANDGSSLITYSPKRTPGGAK